jgi:glycosyltransferase 2 family protein
MTAPADAAGSGTESSSAPPGRRALAIAGRLVASRPARSAFVLVAVGFACYAVAARWPSIRSALGELGFWPLAAALVSILAALATTVQMWRLLLASMGSPLPLKAAARIMLVGQIGKYLPGSIWPVLAQMELGRDYHVPRSRSASASILVMLLTLITGLLTALVTLPFAAGPMPYRWALLATPLLLALAYPPVLNALIGWLLRLARQSPLEHPVTGGALARAMGWAFATWICYGLQIWILATRLGAPAGKTALVAIGGFAFAWSVGFIVVIAPAGAGVRDVLLFVLLRSVLSTADATAVVLVSRVVMTVADLLSAAVAARFVRRPPIRDHPTTAG